jgi:universal stress protein A
MYKHVLLATDLLPENIALFDRGLALAKEWGARVSVVHVVEPLPGYGYAYVGSADVEQSLIKESKKQLAEIAKKYGIDSADTLVDIGPTKTEIIRVAQEKKADLIIIGSHGRSGWSLLLGSTANAVVHSAKCDVLTMRLQGRG